MADGNWQKVREVFDSALRRKAEDRRKYVHEVCGNDKTLLAEVESLLSSLDSAESFMETSAVAKVADIIEAETKQLEKGKCFGHYEIIEQLGVGGMGEVYLARDQKLDRKVAVKILNEKFSRDESNLNRFIQEAKAASALNHPNILVIHEIGESGDTHYIVSEFIKGKTLRETFKEKTLKLSKVLDISIQVGGALCAAHEARLIHRDIKPENVMIRPDGYAKILDFGLAKLVEKENKSILGLEDETAQQNQTAKGVILGTVNYMSPEQAKGERVDERTDIFSLGVVIYEMFAGRTPFAGDSMSETFANLINAEPQSLSRFAANVPDEMQRIVARTLRKNKDERYQTMKGLLADLKDLRENLTLDEKLEKLPSRENGNATTILQATTGGANKPTFIETVQRRVYRFIADVRESRDTALPATQIGKSDFVAPPRPKPYFLIVTGIIFLIGIFGASFIWFRGEDKPPELKQPRFTRLTNNGKVTNMTISPDGKYLVFAQQEGIGESLWLRHLTTSSQMQILPAQAVNFVGLTISPDNDYIYYSVFSTNSVASTLSRIPLLGGSPRGITNVESDVTISFAPDGKRFAFTESHAAIKETHLKTADADGSRQVTLLTTKGDNRAFQVYQANPVAWSPDGKTIACVVRESDENTSFYRILLVNPNDGTEKYLSEKHWHHIRSIVWKNAETLAFINSAPDSKQIWEISRTTGDAKQLTDDLSSYEWLASSGGNLFAVQQNAVSSLQVAEFAENAKTLEPQQIFSESGAIENVVWSANGKIYYNSLTSGKNEIWQMNADGTEPKQLTINSNLSSSFAVSPSDGTLVFSSHENDKTSLRKANPDGQNIRPLTDGTADYMPRFTPDGKNVIFQRDSIFAAIWRVPADGSEPAIKIIEPLASHPAVSPDGKIIAYHSMECGEGKQRWKIALTETETGKTINKVDFPIPISERNTLWHPNGKFLTMIFNNGENVGLLLFSPTDGKYQTIDNISKNKITSFAWSPDGNQFAFSHITEIRDVVSLGGF